MFAQTYKNILPMGIRKRNGNISYEKLFLESFQWNSKLKIMKSKIILMMLFGLTINMAYSQNKKKQIEILNNRVDSLNSILVLERNTYIQKEIESVNQLSTLQKQLESLNTSLTKSKEELSKKEIELKNSNQELMNKLMEIKVLESQVNELNGKLEQFSLNSKIEIIDAPSFSISNSEIIKITDSKMIDPCPIDEMMLHEDGICVKNVTKITYFRKGNAIRFFACVGYAFLGRRTSIGHSGFVLAEYKNSKWIFIDFLQVQYDKNDAESLEIQNQYILGINSFAYEGTYDFHIGGGDHSSGTYIVGFIDDKISLLLEELSGENNGLGGGGYDKPLIAWYYNYKPLPSNNQVFNLERKFYNLDKPVKKKILKYNPKSMKFE
jgi:hypothetical protein